MIIHFFQIISIFLLISFFYFILYRLWNFFKNRIFNKSTQLNLGELGLIGVFLLINISYLSIFLTPHNSIHNILILFIGLVLFFNKF